VQSIIKRIIPSGPANGSTEILRISTTALEVSSFFLLLNSDKPPADARFVYHT